MRRILVACPQPEAHSTVQAAFGREAEVTWTSEGHRLPSMLGRKHYDLVLLDIELLQEASEQDVEAYRLQLDELKKAGPSADIVLLASREQHPEATKALQAGAASYVSLPLHKAELLHVAAKLTELARKKSELDFLRSKELETDVLLHFESKAMREVYTQVKSIADTKTTTLLVGETGVGKGVIARLIHRLSKRKAGPFISLHCGAIPETLFESELFGHEKGAFTGAARRKLGKLELAGPGTVFLDEVGNISPAVQVKLLNVLQDKVFQRVGGLADISLEARILAATNTDLKELCNRGAFRLDLYYRLNVFPIRIPPLRSRLEDIPDLCSHFLSRLNGLYGKNISGLHPSVQESFLRYDWPGNVRELENLLERAYFLETSSQLRPESFPAELFGAQPASSPAEPALELSLAKARGRAADAAERDYLCHVLRRYRGRIDRSAAHAGITPRQLNNLLRKHGLNKIDFKSDLPPANLT